MATAEQIAERGDKYKTKVVGSERLPLTDAEREEAVDRELAAEAYKAANGYKHDREAAYASLQDQLDMLYHDMTADKGDKTGEWYKAITKVKSDNPKPE